MTTAKPRASDGDRIDHLNTKVHEQSSELKALRIDMHHAVKLLDKLVGVSDKQTELSHELSRHSDAIEGVKSQLGKAIDGLTDALKDDREKFGIVAETVTGYKGGLKTLMGLGGVVTFLLLAIGGMFARSIDKELIRTNQTIVDMSAEHERRKMAVDLKLETLMQQVIEVKMDRRRDREAREENR